MMLDYQNKEQDTVLEDYKHKISGICSSFFVTDEQSLKCEIILDTLQYQHLTVSDKPCITDIFHNSQGAIWFKEYGVEESKGFDEYSLDDVKYIYSELVKQYNDGSLRRSMSKEEIVELVECHDVARLNEIISEACSKIREIVWDELRIALDGTMEDYWEDYIYSELKAEM